MKIYNSNKKALLKKRLVDTDEKLKDSKQIQRYLRHIIIPKISSKGQNKIIKTSVLLCAQSIDTCDVLLNYMVASGIGNIYFYLENTKRCESVLDHVRDLNPEINIELIDRSYLQESKILCSRKKVNFNILIGSLDFVTKISDLFIEQFSCEITKTLIAVSYAWQGYINLCNSTKSIKESLKQISKKHIFIKDILKYKDFYKLGISMSNAFMGALVSVEIIKARLNIGNILKDILYFNLLDMLFINNISTSNGDFKNIQNNFNKLSFSVDTLKEELSKKKVLIVGTGGLGCPIAYLLTKVGIGTIGLIDFDTVDISNLNRQILHSTSKIGLKKVESARETLKMINKDVNVEVYITKFSKENAIDIIKNYDVIVDGLDNISTRYLLNDACFFSEKPLIEAGVLAFYGQVTTIIFGENPCYRCIFPESEDINSVPNWSKNGILGPVAGITGILQAVEALKIIIGITSNLKGGLLMYDALETEFDLVKIKKNNNCKLCGSNPTILELGQHKFDCKYTEK